MHTSPCKTKKGSNGTFNIKSVLKNNTEDSYYGIVLVSTVLIESDEFYNHDPVEVKTAL